MPVWKVQHCQENSVHSSQQLEIGYWLLCLKAFTKKGLELWTLKKKRIVKPSLDPLRCMCLSHNSGMPFLGLWKSCLWKAISSQDGASLSPSLCGRKNPDSFYCQPAGTTGLSHTDTDGSFVIFHWAPLCPPLHGLVLTLKHQVTLYKSVQDSDLVPTVSRSCIKSAFKT